VLLELFEAHAGGLEVAGFEAELRDTERGFEAAGSENAASFDAGEVALVEAVLGAGLFLGAIALEESGGGEEEGVGVRADGGEEAGVVVGLQDAVALVVEDPLDDAGGLADVFGREEFADAEERLAGGDGVVDVDGGLLEGGCLR
jgi:hypothetical protein